MCGETGKQNEESQKSQRKAKKKAKAAEDKNERVISENRKARHNYTVLDTLECGIVLVGSEVKSLRIGQLSLDEAYGRVQDDDVWLVAANIAEYHFSHALNHEPKRRRKLLMHRREMSKFADQASEKGLTLVPLKMYFKEGRVKVLIGICGQAEARQTQLDETPRSEAPNRPGHAPEVRINHREQRARRNNSKTGFTESTGSMLFNPVHIPVNPV